MSFRFPSSISRLSQKTHRFLGLGFWDGFLIFAQPEKRSVQTRYVSIAGQAKVKKASKRQAGQLSPFMFGLIMGMSVFSAMSLKWAEQELAEQQIRNQARNKAQAEDLAKALEFATLTQTRDNYDNRMTLDRARQYASSATGQTRGGQDFLIVEREAEGETMGAKNEVVAITGSDDTLRRSEVFRSGDAKQLGKLAEQKNKGDAVVLLDTSGIRTRQVNVSRQNMETMAEHVYAFYAGRFRMPSFEEFQELNEKLGIRDAWNAPFDYEYYDTERSRMEFTTPWGYTQSLMMDLRTEHSKAAEEFEKSRTKEKEQPEDEESNVSPTTPAP